ncbi:MAG: hypothetical protein K9G60_00190 [Pseudolabrys sp.]|nr:hypothetical protein [Pseudolabrys sp.]
MLGRIGAVLGAALLCTPNPGWAGAWTLGERQGQVIATTAFSQADNAFDGSRGVNGTPHYSKFELQTLIEYGITDRFTLMFAPSLQSITIASPTDAARSGFGYTEFGGRYRFLQGSDWVFSGQALLREPGTDQSANPAAVGYTDPEFDIRALFGKSFTVSGLPAYIDLQLAQRFRFGNSPDELRFDATFGLFVAPKWLLLAQSLNVVAESAGSNVLFPSYDYEKLQLSMIYNVTPTISVQFGGFTTFSGRNALQENGLISGLWYKF